MAHATQRITGSVQNAWTFTQACPMQNDTRIRSPKRIDVSGCFIPFPRVYMPKRRKHEISKQWITVKKKKKICLNALFELTSRIDWGRRFQSISCSWQSLRFLSRWWTWLAAMLTKLLWWGILRMICRAHVQTVEWQSNKRCRVCDLSLEYFNVKFRRRGIINTR